MIKNKNAVKKKSKNDKLEIELNIKNLFSKIMLKDKGVKESKEKKTQIKFICKKAFTPLFKVKKEEIIIPNKGKWSEEEHNIFLEGLVLYGLKWKKFKNLIKTRTLNQIRSHAQKFYLKMKLCKDVDLNIDFTLNSIRNINDMINQIKLKNENYNIVNVFKYLNYKYDSLKLKN